MRCRLINFVFHTDMDSRGSTVEEPEGLKTPPSTPNKQSKTLQLQYLHHPHLLEKDNFATSILWFKKELQR